MFERLKDRIAEAHRRDQEFMAESERAKADHESLISSIDHIVNSGGARDRDYRMTYNAFSDRTLALLRDTFATDPKGLIKLLWEAEASVDDTEKFIRERVCFTP